MSYLVRLQSLAKLDDMDGIKNCFEEWESGCSTYDIRLLNVVINAYVRRGMIKEAIYITAGEHPKEGIRTQLLDHGYICWLLYEKPSDGDGC